MHRTPDWMPGTGFRKPERISFSRIDQYRIATNPSGSEPPECRAPAGQNHIEGPRFNLFIQNDFRHGTAYQWK